MRQAPAFCLRDAQEQQVCLKDFAGRWVVLYFYPKDNTPGCTLEALDFTRLADEFSSLDAVVIGVSPDSCASHAKFIAAKGLSVLLLADPDHVVAELYRVWGEKRFMGQEFVGVVRSTFLINPQGLVEREWRGVSAKGHAEDVLAALRAQSP